MGWLHPLRLWLSNHHREEERECGVLRLRLAEQLSASPPQNTKACGPDEGPSSSQSCPTPSWSLPNPRAMLQPHSPLRAPQSDQALRRALLLASLFPFVHLFLFTEFFTISYCEVTLKLEKIQEQHDELLYIFTHVCCYMFYHSLSQLSKLQFFFFFVLKHLRERWRHITPYS